MKLLAVVELRETAPVVDAEIPPVPDPRTIPPAIFVALILIAFDAAAPPCIILLPDDEIRLKSETDVKLLAAEALKETVPVVDPTTPPVPETILIPPAVSVARIPMASVLFPEEVKIILESVVPDTDIVKSWPLVFVEREKLEDAF